MRPLRRLSTFLGGMLLGFEAPTHLAVAMEPAPAREPADPALTSPDPETRVHAGREALRGRGRDVARARAISESLIRDFPGTVYAVAGLALIVQVTPTRIADGGSLAEFAALEARLAEIIAAAPSSTLQREGAELRHGLAWARGMLLFDLGRAGDVASLVACGETFQGLATLHGSEHSRTPIALFNAGSCLVLAGELDRARAAFHEVWARHPRAEVAEGALAELIGIARTLAQFEEAAALMERYTSSYPDSYRAREFIREVVMIRLALGQEKAARDAVAVAEGYHARRDPEKAARYHWMLAELATTDAARQAHAEGYLKRHGKTGGLDRWIVAEARIAAIEWRGACPSGEVNGLCVALPPRTKPTSKSRPRRCAEPTTPTPRPRTERQAQAARARLAAVAKRTRAGRIEIPADDVRRRADFSDAVELSRLAGLDGELESYMAMTMPTGLRLDVEATGEVRRLRTSIEAKWAVGSTLSRGYEEIRAQKTSLQASLAASHRNALIAEHMADQLLSAEIPQAIAGEKAQQAHCRVLREAAEPYLEQARSAYLDCAERAVMFQRPTDASRACDEALARLAPRLWPPLREFVGESTPWGELPPRSVGVQDEAPVLVDAPAAASE